MAHRIREHVKSRVLGIPIQRRLFYTYAVVLVLPITVLLVCAQLLLGNSIVQKSQQRMQRETEIVAKNVEMFVSEIVSYSKLITVNRALQFLLTSTDEPYTTERYLAERTLRQESGYYSSIVNHAVRCEVYDLQARRVTRSEDLDGGVDTEQISALVREKGGTRPYWFGISREEADLESHFVACLRPVRDERTGYLIGTLLAYAREPTLRGIYAATPYTNGELLMILDADGTVLSASQPGYIGARPSLEPSRNGTLQLGGERYFVTHDLLPDQGWRVVNLVPYAYVMSDVQNLTLIIVGVGILCFGLALGIGALFSRTVSRPLHKLVRMTDQVSQGNFTARAQFVGGDEIALLGSRFDIMAEKLDMLVRDMYEQQQQQKNLEIRLIQSQIKPHFLYNSLGTIISFIKLNQEKQAVVVAKNLAEFYRASLSRGSDIITLEQEMRITESYLQIQLLRYSDCLRYTLHLPEEMRDCLVPKLTLQPLVENAIYHGIKESGTAGEIRLTAQRQAGVCTVTVYDTGCGMDEQALRALREAIRSAPGESGFGLSCIQQRFTLMFGEAYGLRIDSKPGEGTTATVTFPERYAAQ